MFVDAQGVEERLPVDTVVVCQGRVPNDELVRGLRGKGVPVQVIGDARTPRSYANAIHEAAYLVRQL